VQRIRSSSDGQGAPDRRPQTPAELAALVRELSRRERRARLLLWIWATATLLWLMPLGPLSAAQLPVAAAFAVGGGSLVAGAVLILLYRKYSHPRSSAGSTRRQEKAARR